MQSEIVSEAPGRSSVFAHPGVDWPTLAVLAGMWLGLAANLAWALGAFGGPAPAWAHVALGVLCLNASFTVWHEGVHGTVFRARWANDVVGVLGAWPAMIPYYMVKSDHELHHEHTNDPERDPDAWFAQASIWTLPLRYVGGMRRARRIVGALRPPTARERWLDRAALSLIPALLALAAWKGALLPVLWCWILPKAIAMWIHAWYVNWLPHRGLPAERYRDTRIVPRTWLAPLLWRHNYHGLHHAWQTVPWHRYAAAFREKREFLERRGAPIRESLLAL